MIDIRKFFTFLKPREKVLMVIGSVSAVIAGIIVPMMAIAMGQVANTFNPSNDKFELLN
jgi:hypothetical protein